MYGGSRATHAARSAYSATTAAATASTVAKAETTAADGEPDGAAVVGAAVVGAPVVTEPGGAVESTLGASVTRSVSFDTVLYTDCVDDSHDVEAVAAARRVLSVDGCTPAEADTANVTTSEPTTMFVTRMNDAAICSSVPRSAVMAVSRPARFDDSSSANAEPSMRSCATMAASKFGGRVPVGAVGRGVGGSDGIMHTLASLVPKLHVSDDEFMMVHVRYWHDFCRVELA